LGWHPREALGSWGLRGVFMLVGEILPHLFFPTSSDLRQCELEGVSHEYTEFETNYKSVFRRAIIVTENNTNQCGTVNTQEMVHLSIITNRRETLCPPEDIKLIVHNIMRTYEKT
jgi:hypothetical protein